MPAPARSSKLSMSAELPVRREVLGILLLGLALFLAIALVSFQIGDRALAGPFGHVCASVLYGLAGLVGYLGVAVIARSAVRVLGGERAMRSGWEWAGLAGGLPALAVLLHLVAGAHRIEGYGIGGLVGEYGGSLLRALVGTAGAVLAASLLVVLGLLATTPLRASALVGPLRSGLVGAARGLWTGLRRGARVAGEAAVAMFPGVDEEDDGFDGQDAGGEVDVEHGSAETGARKKSKRARPRAVVVEELAGSDTERMDATAIAGLFAGGAAAATGDDLAGPGGGEAVSDEAEPAPLPIIVERKLRKTAPAEPAERPDFIMAGTGGFRLPALDLLDYVESGHGELDRSVMHQMAVRLTQTLETYGVRGKVTEIHPGPVVTMYELVPEAGTRIAKIAGLADELAMTLEAMRVRIVAPIPGKNAVGIEVPNPTRETVYLKEILGDESFGRARSKLTMALGKDIAGRPVVVDLAKMPHLLVAGTTGSGKSVSVNSMICSLLYGASPEEVRLIMVDPKMLELSVYEGVPHLLLPVVTDPKKANLALRWAVEEMERRYELLAAAGVRDLASYNRKVERAMEPSGEAEAAPLYNVEAVAEGAGGTERVELQAELAEGTDPGTTEPGTTRKVGRLPPGTKKLPYIVVIIDEFADLMMVAPKEVETSVARIAQKARAAGIHLLLATQRPSVDVITGLIKANFPSRIAFQVSSKVDSRTILDQSGAEALLGQGDMLFMDRGSALRRVHGCLVTDGEIARVVDFLKSQGTPVYDLDILKPREEESDDGAAGGEGELDDSMYDQAVRVVAETRQASISMLQRRLRVGYNRAARMIERMEKEGIVGPGDGPNRREVLISAL